MSNSPSRPAVAAEHETVVSPRILLAAVLALIALVYLPTLRFPFVYDDAWTLVSNGFLRHPEELGTLFGTQAATWHVPDAFRPTLVVFDVLTYQLFGLRPTLHHAVSVLLHVAAAGALARYLEQAGASLLVRLSATALFGLMAIHAEAVAVISFREDLLAAALGLAALATAEGGTRGDSPSVRSLLVAWLLLALACGAKLSAAPLPLVWLLIHRAAPWRPPTSWWRSILTTSILLTSVLLVLAHRFAVFGSLSPYGETTRVFAQSQGHGPILAASAQIHLGYVQQMLWPIGLSPEYVDFGAAWTDPATVIAIATFSLLTMVAARGLVRRRYPVLGITILGALLLAGPTSNVFPMPNMRADRFMYLPSMPVAIGLAVFLVECGQELAARIGFRELVLAPLFAYGIGQGAIAFAASASYANNATLWEVAVERAPLSARAHALRGIQRIVAASERESLDAALLALGRASCRTARYLDPRDELAHVCWGRLRVVERRWVQAHAHFSQALAIHGARTDLVLGALAELSLDLPGDDSRDGFRLAAAYLSRGLREYPYSADLWAIAARIFHRQGHPYTARWMYRTARSMRPERWETVAAAIELALDLGDVASAQRTLLEEAKVLAAADPSQIRAITARLARAQDFWPHSVIQPLLAPGVFLR